MPLDIKHPVKPTEEDKINDDDYMASHVVTGKLPYSDVDIGAGIPQDDVIGLDLLPGLNNDGIGRIPVLIDEQTVDAQSSVTFNDLDGDLDEEYFIIADLVQTAEADVCINYNGDMDNNAHYTDIMLYGRADDVNKNWSNKNRLSTNYAGHYGQTHIKANIYSKTGIYRRVMSECLTSQSDANYSLQGLFKGWWKNSADNITSITLSVATGTLTGTIKLYKMVDVQGLIPSASTVEEPNIRLPVLIEEKNVENVASALFDNLNGDEDENYILTGELTLPGGSGEDSVILQFNSDTSNYSGARHWSGSSHSYQELTNIPLINDIGGSGAIGSFSFEINALSGKYRIVKGRFDNYKESSFDRFMVDVTGEWKNTSDNIVSINLSASRSFTGKIKLYKLVDVKGFPSANIAPNAGEYSGYQLIEKKEVSSVTSTTFSNLDGDEDEEYFFDWSLSFENANPDVDIILKPNNVSTNQYGVTKRTYNTGEDRLAVTTLPLLSGGYQSALSGSGVTKLYATTGKNRLFKSDYVYDSTNNNYIMVCSAGGVWKDTSTNITSIVISSSASFTGTISLYKKIK